MMKQYIALAAAAVLALSSTAWGQTQTTTVQGSVVEQDGGSPVPNAVLMLSTSNSVLGTTDAQGRFTVKVAEGASLRVRALGYT